MTRTGPMADFRHARLARPLRRTGTPLLAAAAALLCAAPALAQGVLTLNSSAAPGGGTSYSVPVQTLLIFTALSFLPAVMLLMTSFTRIVIVLSLLRQALGLQQTPPNQVIVGMSLFLTFFVMAPTLERIHQDAYKPYSEQKINFEEAIAKGADPLRLFMTRQTRESDLTLFAKIAKVDKGTSRPRCRCGCWCRPSSPVNSRPRSRSASWSSCPS